MAFLAFGTWIFWLFVGISLFILLCTIEVHEKVSGNLKGQLGWPVTVFIISVALLIWANHPYEIWGYILDHPLRTVEVVCVYLVLGILWSFYRWSLVVNRSIKIFKQRLEDFKITNPNDKLDYKDYVPKVDDWKASLGAWILFWPISLLRYLFGSALLDFLEEIIERSKGIYNRITEAKFKNLK